MGDQLRQYHILKTATEIYLADRITVRQYSAVENDTRCTGTLDESETENNIIYCRTHCTLYYIMVYRIFV